MRSPAKLHTAPDNGKFMIDHLNDVPEWLLDKARSLADPDAVQALLMEHTSSECWDYLTPFIEDVVFGAGIAADWMRGQVIVPDSSLADQLTLSQSALLAPIGGEFSHRVIPSIADWHSGVLWIGSPALRLPHADYRFQGPDQSIALGKVATEKVTNPTIAVRRWIAARLARVVRDLAEIHSIEQISATQKGIPASENWSVDAKCSAIALVREYRELGQPENAIPGMRGPDAWYSG